MNPPHLPSGTAHQHGPLPDFLPTADGAAEVVPVVAPTGDRIWLVTAFDLGRSVLTDERFSRAAAAAPEAPASHPMRPDPAALTSLDPPQHTRLRRLVNHPFTPRAVAGLEEGIRRQARRLLAGRDRIDLVSQYAMPLSAATICRVLGVPKAEHTHFADLADRALGVTTGDFAEQGPARDALRAYIGELISRARRAPGEHVLGALATAYDEDGTLSHDELTALVELLLNAGYETSIGQLGLAVVTLLEHPEQWHRLAAAPHREAAAAVEELLRHTPVVPMSFTRVARQDVRLGTVVVRAGEALVVSLLHANFDARAHRDPTRLDITRRPARHLTFGHGAHICLGAQLARTQLRVALAELAAAAPGLTPRTPLSALRWRQPEAVVRGPLALPVHLTATRAGAVPG
ncbi:cytochrome P450 [Streptomyces flavofungini]|uniref:Cytochrome P450 n=1 Tax=Streptomyces flavofungini TaxID=68200 RepID=A0ABS0XEY2_9ACTN|nr:cytochrome P450 [Streptomyces flavofungini]MBJ3811773.1 cytochrome P450 [Streptomyces flavofungini]GHC87300.1 cytochrome P450 [Streptomyces flavofungini]